jgi:hypothetical protein
MHRSPAQQVNVKVVDGLATVVSGIDDGSKASRQALTVGNARRNQVEISQQILVFGDGFCQRTDVLTRYNQYVGWRLGIDVPERVRPIVFKDFLRRNLAGHDFAE